MKDQSIETKIMSLVQDIDDKILNHHIAIEELEKAKTALLVLVDPSVSNQKETKLMIHIPEQPKRGRGGSVGRPKKGEKTVAGTTRKFLKEYLKSGEPFTYETLTKRVRGLIHTATDVAIKDQVKTWARKNDVYYDKVTIDGKPSLVITSKHQQ